MRRRTLTRGWRKIAGAAWGPPSDPQFYGEIDVDAGTLLNTRARLQDLDVHVTVTHFVARAVAHALTEVPELRTRMVRGRPHRDETCDVFVIVNSDAGLTGVKLTDVAAKPVTEVAAELEAGAEAARNGSGDLERATQSLSALPTAALRVVMRAGAWLTSDANVGIPALGLARQPFGNAMVSSVGMWGVSRAFSPLAAYYKVPVLVLVGDVEQRPAARAGQVVIRPMLTVTATFDHRRVDGLHAARFARAARDYLEHPDKYEAAADARLVAESPVARDQRP
jgi:pyruvate dehydrogenase E2 component (dihydrolipoamide acetyltransferase)